VRATSVLTSNRLILRHNFSKQSPSRSLPAFLFCRRSVIPASADSACAHGRREMVSRHARHTSPPTKSPSPHRLNAAAASSCKATPSHRNWKVLCNTLTVLKHEAQAVLSACIPPRCCKAPPSHNLCLVSCNNFAIIQRHSNRMLSHAVASNAIRCVTPTSMPYTCHCCA
jgi:hypothetical protein